MLKPSDIDLITRLPLGFVASVSSDGRPNLSPKGTFLVLNDKRIAFSEIRSPQTVKNLQHSPFLEVNFVDPFTRKGLRASGQASLIRRGEDPAWASLYPRFAALWPDLSHRMKSLVEITLEAVKPLSTPPYDDGALEADMIALYQEKYKRMYP